MHCVECGREHSIVICSRCGDIIHPEPYGARNEHCNQCRTELYLQRYPDGPIWVGITDDVPPKIVVYSTVQDSSIQAYVSHVSNMGDRRWPVRALMYGQPWHGIMFEFGSIRLVRTRDKRRTKDLSAWLRWDFDTM